MWLKNNKYIYIHNPTQNRERSLYIEKQIDKKQTKKEQEIFQDDLLNDGKIPSTRFK